MTIVQTVLVYVLIPAAVLVLFAALTLWPRPHKEARYRCGEGWAHAPVWWAANPQGVGEHAQPVSLPAGVDAPGAHALGGHGLGSTGTTDQQSEGALAGVVGGGARGTW